MMILWKNVYTLEGNYLVFLFIINSLHNDNSSICLMLSRNTIRFSLFRLQDFNLILFSLLSLSAIIDRWVLFSWCLLNPFSDKFNSRNSIEGKLLSKAYTSFYGGHKGSMLVYSNASSVFIASLNYLSFCKFVEYPDVIATLF